MRKQAINGNRLNSQVNSQLNSRNNSWNLKLIIISGLVISIWLYHNKHQLAVQLAQPYLQPYLQPYGLTLTCLDVSFNWKKLSSPFILDKLCLSHPYGEITAHHLKLDRLIQPSHLQLAELNLITPYTVNALNQLLKKPNKSQSQPSLQRLFASINQLLTTTIPIDFQIQQVNIHTTQVKPTIIANGAIHYQDSMLSVQLNYLDQYLTVVSNLDSKQLEIAIHLQGKQLSDWLTSQQITLPIHINDGALTAQIQYQTDQLQIQYQSEAPLIAQLQSSNNEPLTIAAFTPWQGKLFITPHQIQWHNGPPAMVLNITGPFSSKARHWLNQWLDQWPTDSQQQLKLQQLITANSVNTIQVTLPKTSLLTWQNPYRQNQRLSLSRLQIAMLNNDGSGSTHRLLSEFHNIDWQIESLAYRFDLQASGSFLHPDLTTLSEHPLTVQLRSQVNGDAKSIQLSEDSQLSLQVNQLNLPQDQGKVTQFTFNTQGPLSWQQQLTTQPLTTQQNWSMQFTGLDLKHLIGLDTVNIDGQSQISPPQHQSSDQMHTTAQLTLDPSSSEEKAIINCQLNGDLNQVQFSLEGNSLQLAPLFALNRSDFTLPDLSAGEISFQLNSQVNLLQSKFNPHTQGEFQLTNLSGTYQDIHFKQLNYQQGFIFKEDQLTSHTGNFSLDTLTAGVELNAIQTKVTVAANWLTPNTQPKFQLGLHDFTTQLLNGEFQFDTFHWPNTSLKPVNLQVSRLDLAKVMDLEKQQGILITGLISGKLPIYLKQKEQQWQITVDNGELYNVSEGIIQVKNNPTVQRLKNSREDLKLAFEALQNLHYHYLAAEVAMNELGQMYLNSSIKGLNPDIKNQVNFNLNLDYDLLGLLKSALISQKFEQQLNQQLDKPVN